MMMTVRAVDVAVRDFFRGRGTHVEHLRVEAQPLARKLVIAVEHRLAIRNVGHAPHDFVAILLGDKVAAHGDVGRQVRMTKPLLA